MPLHPDPDPTAGHPPTGDAELAEGADDSAPGAEQIVPPLPPGRFVDLPGRGTTWVREAAGPAGAPTVVLLHGWSVTADLNWFTSYFPLAAHFHVVALDHRGHGRGLAPPGGRVQLRDCADDVVALLDVLGIDRAVVVGYSMGGPVAQLVWQRHPHRVSGLVLCATAKHFQGGPLTDLWYRSYGALGRVAHAASGPSRALMGRMLERKVRRGPLTDWMRDELRRSDPAGILSAMASLGRFRSSKWIGGVTVPAAVVITSKDRTVSPFRQRALAKAIPGATSHVVEGPHDACASQPERFLPPFLDACRSVADRIGVGAGADAQP